MNRREFLTGGGGTLAAALAAGGARGEDAPREYYELKLFSLRRGPMVQRTESFWRDAAIPAMKRAGVGPVGVFNVATGADSPTLHVLIPHPSLQSIVELPQKLADDAEFRAAGREFLQAPATDPSYVRIESSLMAAFTGIPKLEVPPQAADGRPRLFELRTYESHSHAASRKKIEMFNIGEIAIFRRTRLRPVFFGETLIGTRIPNLTYMLVYDDAAARERAWGTFVADPEWKALSAKPEYADSAIVSRITSVLLRPAPFSQI